MDKEKGFNGRGEERGDGRAKKGDVTNNKKHTIQQTGKLTTANKKQSKKRQKKKKTNGGKKINFAYVTITSLLVVKKLPVWTR